MQTEEVPRRLAAIGDRRAGSDGERRAAVWLRGVLRDRGERVAFETVWVRPDWPASLALHIALAVAGTAVSVSSPAVGLALVLVALASLVGELTGAFLLLRRLTPARATQNVIAAGRAPDQPPRPGRLRVVLTANVDAGRTGAVYRDGWVRAEAALRRRLGGHLPSMPGVAALLIAILAALAGARLAGASGAALGVAQLVPTLLLLAGLALLADVVLAEPAPGANVNASGVAAALAVLSELRRSPPSHLDVELLLAGAGDQEALGVSAFIADRRRRGWAAQDVAVVAIEPCGVGTPCYLTHDGPLLPLRLHPQLITCARAAAAADPLLGARPHRAHGAGAAYAARRRRWPAIALAALDQHGRPGPTHQPADAPEAVTQRALADAVELCLGVIEQLDAGIGVVASAAQEPRPANASAMPTRWTKLGWSWRRT